MLNGRLVSYFKSMPAYKQRAMLALATDAQR
jgi:hypothetical protein